jgi:hypothetical protein
MHAWTCRRGKRVRARSRTGRHQLEILKSDLQARNDVGLVLHVVLLPFNQRRLLPQPLLQVFVAASPAAGGGGGGLLSLLQLRDEVLERNYCNALLF